MVCLMKNKFFMVLAAIFFLATSAQAEPATVVNVVDGDTLKVATEQGITIVRLYGVDSPERSQAHGQSARDFVASMVFGKIVDVASVGRDRYGRTVALVMVGTQCLQEQLLLQGYAWVYPQYCRERFCQAWTTLQGISAGNKVGLWMDPAPVQPWVWRKQSR